MHLRLRTYTYANRDTSRREVRLYRSESYAEELTGEV